MKKLLLASLMAFSFSAFSQSYVILANGVLLTTDKAGFVYDLVQYVNPYKIRINGGNYLVNDERLFTVSSEGFYFEKDFKIKKIRGQGLNYMLDNSGDLIAIANDGTYVKYDESGKELKKAHRFGGNFFLVLKDKKKNIVDLYSVNDKAAYFKLNIPGLNPADISVLGGNYFMANGKLFTVSSAGVVFEKSSFYIPALKKMGGNFFVDSMNRIWTVSEEGILSNPALPLSFKLSNIDKYGSNYMIDTDGVIYTIDSKGFMNARTMEFHDVRNAKILSK